MEWPLNDIALLELCRHVEYLVAEQLGPALVAPFIHWWRSDSPAPRDQLLADRWRVVRNYLLRQLKKLPEKAHGFLFLQQMFNVRVFSQHVFTCFFSFFLNLLFNKMI